MGRSTILALGVLLGGLGHALAAGDWNDAQVAWKPYAEGLAEARASSKPVCLVLYTDWCGQCAAYSGVFHDAAVVEASRAFVMIRVERDGNPEISARYAPDGTYIPRTFFLAPDGRLEPTLQAPRDTFRYFYDPRDPGALLGGMRRALETLAASSAD